jgi:hypothetical protein
MPATIYSVTMKITNGYGNRDRQVIEIRKHFTVTRPGNGSAERGDAIAQATRYARELGLGALLDSDDVRVSYDASLGIEPFT